MREVALRVEAAHAEDVLDRLLLLVAGGVREVARGEEVELCVRGAPADLPPLSRLAAAAGPWLRGVVERELPDDWESRRAADFAPLVVAGRLAVRPAWAPSAGRGMLEVVLPAGADAFGAGTHPTTRLALELLAGLPPAGAFADLGCGTGVLAVAAARLGWAPVTAVDLSPDAVAAAREAAALNDVTVDVRAADLTAAGGPAVAAGTAAANVPLDVHVALAAHIAELPGTLVATGFTAAKEEAALAGWRERGLTVRTRSEAGGWRAAVLAGP